LSKIGILDIKKKVKMKVLVLGSGSREHALCWRLRQSPSVKELFCAPGNPGTASVAKNISIDVSDIHGLVEFALHNSIDLTIAGPELPLSLGVADLFIAKGLRIFGPVKEAAKIEGSKSYAKEIMSAANVPTADYKTFFDKDSASKFCDQHGVPLVIKADGLAGGKGVCVCTEENQIKEALNFVFTEIKASQVVVEDFLDGTEASYIVAAAGDIIVAMASSHDYKRLLDRQRGPNTGGMGSVSPTPNLKPEQDLWVIDHVIKPTLNELKKRGTPFCGFLYAGLMIDKHGKIKVLEFNARMGDPECQSIMRRYKGDFAELLFSLASLSLNESSESLPSFEWINDSCVTIVAAASGYPAAFKKGDEILGIENAENISDVKVFQGGTVLNASGKLVTAGGRVLSITALGKDLEEARQKAYRAADIIQFKGMHIRRDVGR